MFLCSAHLPQTRRFVPKWLQLPVGTGFRVQESLSVLGVSDSIPVACGRSKGEPYRFTFFKSLLYKVHRLSPAALSSKMAATRAIFLQGSCDHYQETSGRAGISTFLPGGEAWRCRAHRTPSGSYGGLSPLMGWKTPQCSRLPAVQRMIDRGLWFLMIHFCGWYSWMYGWPQACPVNSSAHCIWFG